MERAARAVGELVDQVSAVVEENTAATEQMAASSNEVTQAIEDISSVSEENSASVEEVSASAQEMSAQVEEVAASAQSLNEMAQILQGLVSQFKLADSEAEPTVAPVAQAGSVPSKPVNGHHPFETRKAMAVPAGYHNGHSRG